jgi:hypothetical protein
VARSSSTEHRAPGAFGLEIDSDADLPGLDAPSAARRQVRHRLVPDATLADVAGELLGSGGDRGERIDYHRCAEGILIRAGRYGDHLVGATGTEVRSAIERADPRLWPGHVLGQALPLAASAQGLEVFHAGAVAIGDGVLALAGPSGIGKSTLVDALVAAGAGFFADDVLAVERAGEDLIAYPGPTPRVAWHRAGPPATTARVVRRRLPVRAFLRLAPAPAATSVEFHPCPTERLLESTFDGISPQPWRRLRLLEVAALLAPLAEELRFRAGADPAPVAVAILARFGGPDANPASAG